MFMKDIPRGSISPPREKQRINQRFLKAEACLIALLTFMLLSATAFGQSGAASLTGTIQDASGGVLTGANVVARNVDTGVETRATSNDRGIYTFPSLPIGQYEISAEAAGFSRAARSIRLNLGSQARLDINMAVAGTVTEIAVTGAVESVILEAGTSTGTVMQEEILTAIPLLSNNIMDLITVMGGVVPNTGDPNVNYNMEFAGVNSRQINISRDGMSVNEGRFPTGIAASMNINPEMVSEFKMVLSPVDAEMGRGAGQIQMTTRSGSNAFHGSAVWNIQNTALDSQDFSAKLTDTPKPWRNLNNYMLTASGPIIKNRTFFFATWEQQLSRSKMATTAKVLTPCAKMGIYRWVEGWAPLAASENNVFNPDSFPRSRPSVDYSGNILLGGTFNVIGTGVPMSYDPVDLKFESVFGPLDRTASWYSQFIDPKNDHGVYGDCGVLPFNGTTGQFGTTGPWDTRDWGSGFNGRDGRAYHYQYDPTGYVDRFTNGIEGLTKMPDVNVWNEGDGLNYAGHRWIYRLKGEGGNAYGSGGDPERKSINFRIDHNINSEHRLSGTYTYESAMFDDSYPTWPPEAGGVGGRIERKPQSFLVSLTSTLRPTLLNEARFGLNRSYGLTLSVMDSNGDKIRPILQALLPTNTGIFSGSRAEGLDVILGAGEQPLLFGPDGGNGGSSHPYGAGAGIIAGGYFKDTWGSIDPRWTISDTMTWMKGSHSFKGGVEYRRQRSNQVHTGSQAFGLAWADFFGATSFAEDPIVFGGLTSGAQERRVGMIGDYAPGGAKDDGVSWRGIPAGAQDNAMTGTMGANYTTPYALMTYFSGAVGDLRRFYYAVPDANSPYGTGSRWNDLSKGEDGNRYGVIYQELHFFFKDDWKVTNDVTLNLGIRYEYYGVPHISDGRTLAHVGGGTVGNFGISDPGFDKWMKNRTYYKDAPGVIPEPVSMYQYVGPGSQHPDILPWGKDMNNFAPHLGFSWQLPWFGKGLTTLRGGWSVSYGQLNTSEQYGTMLAEPGGATTILGGRFRGADDRNAYGTTNHYMDITDLPNLLPLDVSLFGTYPLRVYEVGSVYSSGSSFPHQGSDYNIRNPYTNNFNMSLTRNIGRNLTVDVRYIGTMGRKQTNTPGGMSLNQGNFIDNGLYVEFEKLRRGEQSAVINSLIPPEKFVSGMFLPGATGSEQLMYTGYGGQGSALANLSFSGLASTLGTSNGSSEAAYVGQQGAVLFRSGGCLPEDRPGYLEAFKSNPRANVNDYTCQYGTPWNYIFTNPQTSGTTYVYNAYETNYHSMQAQVTMRPTRGLSFQATYTWSRNLANSGWTNYIADRDYVLSGQHRSHTLNTYGTWDLPFGANGFLFRDASGAFKKAVEGWQLSWITTMASGAPMSATGASTMWGTSYPVLVRPDLWDDKAGDVNYLWSDDGRFLGGNYYGDGFAKVLDRNICNDSVMQGDANTPGTLYYQYCERNNGGASQLFGPRAMAMAHPTDRDGAGNRLPLRYSSLQEALQYDPYALEDVVGFNTDGSPIYAPPPVIIFRNANQLDFNPADPGAYLGNYKATRLTGPGRFTFDVAMSKSVEFMEGKRLEVRIDAQNILNHPNPSGSAPSSYYGGRQVAATDPANLGIGGTTQFGTISNKGGHRTFQARLALRF